jgi:hypothetical protein
MEFCIVEKSGKVGAESVRRRPRGTIVPEEIISGILEGKVVRGLRITNADQAEYCGLIQANNSNGKSGDPPPSPALPVSSFVAETPAAPVSSSGSFAAGGGPLYTYAVMSLLDKRDLPQRGELVRFQLSVIKDGCCASSASSLSMCTSGSSIGSCASADVDTKHRATRVLPVRKLVHSKVESIRGQYGMLAYESEEGKKVTFALSEITPSYDGSDLAPGDEVEFAPIRKPHTGKLAAYYVRKIGDRPRPERLARLKSVAAEDLGPRVTTVRQPRGPDGTKGFKHQQQAVQASVASVLPAPAV